jgi:hypothetical protein
VFKTFQHIPRIRIEHAVTWDHHRGGWKQGMSWLYRYLHTDDGTLFIPSVDEFLVTGRVLREPWVGVIHGAPRTFYRFPDLERLLAMDTFKANARWCRGLWALSHYVAGHLRSHEVPFLVGTLPYAVDHDVAPFSFAAFKDAAPRRLLLVGEYLRRYDRFYELAAPGYTKLLLRCFPDGETQRDLQTRDGVTVLDRIGDAEYDEWLQDSMLFLDLVDAPATTAICECIARSTPVLVNRVGAVEEYLGADYPLYFDSLDEAAAKLQDLDLIARTVTHLRRRRRQLNLTFERFVGRVATSAIYRALPIPQSHADGFRRHDLSVLVCSYRRTHNLARILESLCNQTYRGAIEVIVWNNNGDAVSAVNEALEPFKSRLDVTTIHSDRNFYCVVRLAVPHLMSSDLLMICDDDVQPGHDYLQTFVNGLAAADGRSVICARGHTFAEHELDVDHPEAVWNNRRGLQFWDETADAREVHFMHADNCLIPRAALLELAGCALPRPQFALVDDYWMSMTLARDLNWKLWKIQAASAFNFDPSADDQDVALYKNPAVHEQRIDFYVHHMLAGWPRNGSSTA